VSGSEANKAAQTELRFAISEMATTTMAVTATLMTYGHIAKGSAYRRVDRRAAAGPQPPRVQLHDMLGPAAGRRDVPAIAADIALSTLEQHDLLSHVNERHSFEHAP
jgi:hypothetical protein